MSEMTETYLSLMFAYFSSFNSLDRSCQQGLGIRQLASFRHQAVLQRVGPRLAQITTHRRLSTVSMSDSVKTHLTSSSLSFPLCLPCSQLRKLHLHDML
jgi:hypothetical protein